MTALGPTTVSVWITRERNGAVEALRDETGALPKVALIEGEHPAEAAWRAASLATPSACSAFRRLTVSPREYVFQTSPDEGTDEQKGWSWQPE